MDRNGPLTEATAKCEKVAADASFVKLTLQKDGLLYIHVSSPISLMLFPRCRVKRNPRLAGITLLTSDM